MLDVAGVLCGRIMLLESDGTLLPPPPPPPPDEICAGVTTFTVRVVFALFPEESVTEYVTLYVP